MIVYVHTRRNQNNRQTDGFGFWFLVCYAATQVATQLRQRCIQVVRSKEARKRLTESNGTPAIWFGGFYSILFSFFMVLFQHNFSNFSTPRRADFQFHNTIVCCTVCVFSVQRHHQGLKRLGCCVPGCHQQAWLLSPAAAASGLQSERERAVKDPQSFFKVLQRRPFPIWGVVQLANKGGHHGESRPAQGQHGDEN